MIAIVKSTAIAFVIASAVLLAACTAVLNSHVASTGTQGSQCRGGKAAYYLPKRLISIQLAGGVLTVTPASDDAGRGTNTAVADTRYGPFCLAYSGSVFADDRLSVTVNAQTSLLEAVKFNADDKTNEVAIELINALGDFAAFALSRSEEDVALEPVLDAGPFLVDPFDLRRMAEINALLDAAGFCIFLDARDDQFVPSASNEMCAKTGYPQVGRPQVAGLQSFDAAVDLKKYQGQGVLYRPLLSHQLVVMQRKRPGQWSFVKSQYIDIPNAAPAFLLHVDRSWIGDSKTTIAFDRGTPYSIDIAKESELNVFIDIPLSVLQVAVAIPLKAISFRAAEIENKTTMIKVNAALIATLERYEKQRDADTLRGLGLVPPQGPSVAFTVDADSDESTFSQRLEDCLDNTVEANDLDPTSTCLGIITKGL
jgi:hypothetical protein